MFGRAEICHLACQARRRPKSFCLHQAAAHERAATRREEGLEPSARKGVGGQLCPFGSNSQVTRYPECPLALVWAAHAPAADQATPLARQSRVVEGRGAGPSAVKRQRHRDVVSIGGGEGGSSQSSGTAALRI